MAAAWMFGIFVTLFLAGSPIGLALIAASIIGILIAGGLPMEIAAQRVFAGLDSFSLIAVPLFILAGAVMETGGIMRRVLSLADAAVGHLRGGLAQAVTVGTVLLSDISGSSTADTAAVGGMMIPAMREKRYPLPLATALVAASGAMGILIPPCITMIVYAVIADVSIGALFVAGFLPGLLMAASIMCVTYWNARRGRFPDVARRPSAREFGTALKSSSWALLMPVIIIGGIVLGVFTATEAAAVAVVYGFAVSRFVYRELRRGDALKIAVDAFRLTGLVGLLIAGASVFAWLLASEGVSASAAEFLQRHAATPVLFLILANVLFLVAGSFLEAFAAVTILIPLLVPVVQAYSIDPVHFGVITVANLGIGMITPPMAVCLYVAAGIAGVPPQQVIRPLLPYLAAMLFALALITYVPAISLFLPRVLMGYGG